jgi:phage terminase large subunit-like protein
MGLSNTATPKYYGEFRDRVLRGEIPVNEEVSLEMNRIDALIANPYYYYDDRAIDGFISYCENELCLTDGSPVHMLESFKLWAEQLLSWFYFVERSVYVPSKDNHGGRYETKLIKKRLTVKQYLIVARGAAKSMYAFFVQAYFLNIDTTTTHQITTAPTMKQAEEVMSPFRTSITRSRGPLFKFLTEGSMQNTTGNRLLRQKLASTKIGIQNFLTDSKLEIRPMSINKLQGLRPKISTVDEWLSGDVREDVIGAIEQGASKDDQEYLIIAISSEGTVRNGVGDSIKMELSKILRGEGHPSPHISIFHYKLDNISEVADPAMWPKANPNIGLTVTYDVYQQDVERAENNPSVRNDILAKRFGIPMEGFTFYFTYEETVPSLEPMLEHRFNGMMCALGADLSQGDDFTAFTFLFPMSDESFGIKTRSYISQNTMDKLQMAMRDKYEEFIKEGSLHVLPGINLDMDEVFDDLDKHITTMNYDVRAFGYDPYNAKVFVDRWVGENGPYGVEKVIQGARTESVPLGELKNLSEKRLLLFDEQLLKFAMGNTVTQEDTNGNRKIYKLRQDAKIDNMSALMDAYIAWKAHKGEF